MDVIVSINPLGKGRCGECRGPTGCGHCDWRGCNASLYATRGPECLVAEKKLRDVLREKLIELYDLEQRLRDGNRSLRAERDALRDVDAGHLSRIDGLKTRVDMLTEENVKMKEVLRLIASPKRPDGTWNRDREACRILAESVLEGMEDEG